MAGEWDVVAEQPVNAPRNVSRGTSPWDVVEEAPLSKPYTPGVRDVTAPEAAYRFGKGLVGRASEYAGAPVVGLADVLARAKAGLTGGEAPDWAGAVDRTLGVRNARAMADEAMLQPGERAGRGSELAIGAGGEFGKMVPEMMQGGMAAARLPLRAVEAAKPWLNIGMDLGRGAVTGAPSAGRLGREKEEALLTGGATPFEAGAGGAATTGMTLGQFAAPVAAPARAAALPVRVAERAATGGSLGASANSSQVAVENAIAALVAPGAKNLQQDPFSPEVLAMGAIPGAALGQLAGRAARAAPRHADLGYGPPEPPLEILPSEPPAPREPAPRPPLELVRDDAPVFTPPRPDVSEPGGGVPVAPDWEIASGAPRAVKRGFDEPPIEPTEAGITQLVAKVLKDQVEAKVESGIGRTIQDVAQESGVPVKVEPRVDALPYGPPDNTPAARTAARVEADTNAMRPNVPMDILKTLDTVARESDLPRAVTPRVEEVGAKNAKAEEPPVAGRGDGSQPPDILGGDRPAGPRTADAAQPDGAGIPARVEAGSDALAPRADAPPAAPSKPPKAPKTRSLLGVIRKFGGIELKEMRDIIGEDRAGRGRKGVVPGLFRNQGRGLDDLATELRDEGWNINTDDVDGGVQQMRDMIRDELDGNRHYTMEDEMAVAGHDQASRDYDHQQRMEGDPEYRAEQEKADREAEEVVSVSERPDGWSKMTEDEKNAELDKIFGPEPAAKDAREVGTREETGARQGEEEVGRERQPGEDDGFELEQPTERGLRERAAADERAGAEQRRVEAAPPPEDFKLSGSDRAADEAAARGQQELPTGEPKTSTGGKLFAGPPIEEMFAFGKEVAGRTLGPWKEWREAGLKMKAAAQAVADAFASKVKGAASKGPVPVGGESVPGAISRAIFYNVHSHIKSFGEAWKSPTVGKIADMIYSTAGKAQEGQAFHEAAAVHISERQRPLSDIVADVEKLREAGITDEQIIRQVENPQARQGAVGKTAAKIEKWLAAERDYQMKAGAELGEQKNYFPREYDKAKIIPRQADFVKDATRAYEAMGLRGDEAKQAAEAFWYRRAYGSEGSPSFKPEGGKAAFTKARELTPEAAEHLRTWRTAEIGDTLNAYLMRSTRRAEIARRFGDGWSRWEGLEREIIKEAPGITQEALKELRGMTASAMGLRAQSMGVAAHTGAQYLRLWTTLATMPKAAFSSIAETWIPLARANGDLAVTVNHLRNVLYENGKSLLSQALTGKRPDAQQKLFDFAEDIGALSQSPMAHLMADRWMGGDVESKAVSAITSKFFRLNMLEQMTTWQRAMSVDAAMIWMRRLSKNVEAGRKDADLFLRELGVPDGKIKDFAAYVRKMGDELPEASNLTGEHGANYRNAINRFVRQSIQDPNAATRPSWANTDWGAVVFQLQGFANAFHKNVLLRQANLLKEGVKGDYSAAERAALMGGMIPGLMMSAATAGLVWEIRDRIYNKEPKQRTTQAKVERAISGAGLTGALDPYMQMIGGIRYQRSPAAAAGGPSFGAVDSVVSTLGQYVANNSDKTNAAERKAADTFYAWGIEPAATLLLAASPAPVAPATQALTVLAIPASRQAFVDAAAGPKSKKKEKPIRGIFEPKP